ncbi:MAG: ABC transporter substrate-binding protein [Rhodospirillaceae bacterium]
MIWLKITMAALMSGALFAAVDFVLPPRPPQPFTIQISDWPGDQLFALIEPLELAPPARLVRLEIRRGGREAPARDVVEAFRAGLADAALIGLERLPELLSDEVRVIYTCDEVVGGGGLVAAPGVMRTADLGNRPIGITFGGASDPLLAALLGRAGLDAGSVSLVTLAPEAAEAALRAGRVGAVALLSPSRIKGLQDTLGSVLLASTQDLAGRSTHVLVVKEGRIPDQRDHLVAVLRALSRSARTCRVTPERCLELLASASGRAASDWRRDFEAVRLLDAADNHALLGGGNDGPLARRLAALPGLTRPLPPAMEWLDPSLAEEAARP